VPRAADKELGTKSSETRRGTVAGAVSNEGRIYTYDVGEARLNARMIGRASRVVILADSSKFGQTATFAIGAVPPGATIVSDEGLSAAWRERLTDLGITVVISNNVDTG